VLLPWVDATAPAADAGEAAAIARPLMPVAVLNRGTQNRDTVIARKLISAQE